jgi:astacin (peptidase family M12A)
MKTSRLFIAITVYVVIGLFYAGGAQVPTANVRSANVLLPGHKAPTLVRFKIERGRAIFQGDIDLGPADRLEQPVGKFLSSRRRGVGSLSQPLAVKAGDDYLWPGGIVPFELDSNLLTTANQPLRSNVQAAIDFWNNNTNLEFVPRSDAPAFIHFTEDSGISGSGQSRVGMGSGSQSIKLKSSASRSTVIHEIGHAVGLYHEQSRRDRDANVEVLFNNILPGEEHNFEKHLDDGIDFGPYDTTSRMHYTANEFARRDPLTGQLLTTIRSRIPGIAINPSDVLSAQDIAGINRLYPRNDCGSAPILFEHDGKSGRQVSLQFSEPDLHRLGIGDNASSICVPMSWSVDLFEHTEYGGARHQVVGPAEILDLKREMPDGRNWGDTISSARVSGGAANPIPNSCQVATVFEHHNYRGREMQLTADVANLHQFALGDNITSVCVPAGVTITLFEDTGHRGEFVELTGPINIPHLKFDTPGGEDWNDIFSSAKLAGAIVNIPPPACRNNPVLFADDNFRGERLDVTANLRDLHQRNFGDKASSICVPMGWTITLFQHTEFGGQSLNLGSLGHVADLKRDRPGGQDWGDTVSSVQVTPPAGVPEVNCTSPVLFEHDGFQGRQFPLLRDTTNLHAFDAGDKASSACIPVGWLVVLFENTDFGGNSLPLTGPFNIRDMKRDRPSGQDWGDKVSSVRVTPPAGTPAFTACTSPTLYYDDHYRGRHFTIVGTVNDLHAQGNGDNASSMCIPPGFSLTFFENKNLTGKNFTRAGPTEIFDLKRDRPDGQDWGDKISSIRVN